MRDIPGPASQTVAAGAAPALIPGELELKFLCFKWWFPALDVFILLCVSTDVAQEFSALEN